MFPTPPKTALLQGSLLEGYAQAGAVTVFSTEDELSKIKEENNEASICVLKTPKFWQWCDKLRATYLQGKEKQNEWTKCKGINV